MTFMQKDDASFISIHALRKESDGGHFREMDRGYDFNPRSP